MFKRINKYFFCNFNFPFQINVKIHKREENYREFFMLPVKHIDFQLFLPCHNESFHVFGK